MVAETLRTPEFEAVIVTVLISFAPGSIVPALVVHTKSSSPLNSSLEIWSPAQTEIVSQAKSKIGSTTSSVIVVTSVHARFIVVLV